MGMPLSGISVYYKRRLAAACKDVISSYYDITFIWADARHFRIDHCFVKRYLGKCLFHAQCSSIPLRSISLAGLRPIKRSGGADAFMQA